jgi:CheY-like chemotaxis protein
VSDTGIGIAPANLKRLFQPFDRLQSISGEGAGLGLALCKRLVEMMGGRIGVESKPGEGAVFWIELPETESPLARFECSETKSVDSGDKVRTHEKTLLYIEDNLSNLRLIEHILENQPQIKLISAMEGGPGVDLALKHSPDLVLLDLNLPDISGFEVLQRLRREPRTIGTPVVVVSADATARQIDRLMTAGATEYLVKPIDVKKFVSVVDQILGAAEAQTA